MPPPSKLAFLKNSTKVRRIGCTKDDIIQRPKLMPWPSSRMSSIGSQRMNQGRVSVRSVANWLNTPPRTPPVRPRAKRRM